MTVPPMHPGVLNLPYLFQVEARWWRSGHGVGIEPGAVIDSFVHLWYAPRRGSGFLTFRRLT